MYTYVGMTGILAHQQNPRCWHGSEERVGLQATGLQAIGDVSGYRGATEHSMIAL